MEAIAASRAVVVLIGAALILAGVGFAGYAIMLALLPRLGAIGAAAATAAVFLIVPLVYLAIAAWRAPPRVAGLPVAAALTPETAVLSALATTARSNPLLAIAGAALFGAASVWLNPAQRPRARLRSETRS